jgi:Predicted acetyltransferase
MLSYTVRDYTNNDLEECTDCYIGGFFERNEPKDRKFLRDCMDALVGISNFTLIAETDGKIAGFIGVSYKETFSKELSKSSNVPGKRKNFVTIGMKRHLRLYRLSPEFKKEFERFFSEVMMKPDITDDCDCEIVVLSSRKDLRKGVGTALVEEAIARCKRNGASRMRIATDTSWNHSFYGRFGSVVYEKEHVIDGIPGTTFVYEISLR